MSLWLPGIYTNCYMIKFACIHVDSRMNIFAECIQFQLSHRLLDWVARSMYWMGKGMDSRWLQWFFSSVQRPCWLWGCKRQRREADYSSASGTEVKNVLSLSEIFRTIFAIYFKVSVRNILDRPMCRVTPPIADSLHDVMLKERDKVTFKKLTDQQVMKWSYIGRMHRYVSWSGGIAPHIRHWIGVGDQLYFLTTFLRCVYWGSWAPGPVW
jgi:hypothetical protein